MIGITQRIVYDEATAELRDCIDSRWYKLLETADLPFILIPNGISQPVEYSLDHGVRGILLTGGGGFSHFLAPLLGEGKSSKFVFHEYAFNRDRVETDLLKASKKLNWPVLGVCRGMQMLNLFHGGGILAGRGHVGTRHQLTQIKPSIIHIPNQVNSFHDYLITNNTIGRELVPLAFCGNSIEALMHNELKHYGIMWHPEREASVTAGVEMLDTIFSSRSE